MYELDLNFVTVLVPQIAGSGERRPIRTCVLASNSLAVCIYKVINTKGPVRDLHVA